MNFRNILPVNKRDYACTTRRRILLFALLWMAVIFCDIALAANPYINLGRQADLTAQPYVTIDMVRTEDDGQVTEVGPYGSGYGVYPYNSWLLDTGANSAVVISDAAEDMLANGMVNEGLYYEQGVAGYSELYISAAHQMTISSSTGDSVTLPQTDDGVRVMNSKYISVGGDAELGGISGIIGMPAMIDRVTTLDFSSWFDLTDILEVLTVQADVKFPTTGAGLPHLPGGNGHRYSVSVDTRRVYLPEHGLSSDAPPDAPLPVWAPVPFMTATTHAHDAQGNPTSSTGDFLFDTGAQMSLITREMAFALGLDTDGSGNFQEEMLMAMPVGGIGGTVNAELLLIDKIHLPTDQGVDLVWAPLNPEDGGLEVLVLPEDATPLPFSVFGIDFITGGQIINYDFNDIFNSTIEGNPYFEQVHLDFRTLETDGTGKIYFDLAARVDNVINETIDIPGDANQDGYVDVIDLGILATNYGVGSGLGWRDGDFNGNGVVDVSDLGALATNYGTAASQSVPEPSTFAGLLGLCLVGLWTLGRRNPNSIC